MNYTRLLMTTACLFWLLSPASAQLLPTINEEALQPTPPDERPITPTPKPPPPAVAPEVPADDSAPPIETTEPAAPPRPDPFVAPPPAANQPVGQFSWNELSSSTGLVAGEIRRFAEAETPLATSLRRDVDLGRNIDVLVNYPQSPWVLVRFYGRPDAVVTPATNQAARDFVVGALDQLLTPAAIAEMTGRDARLKDGVLAVEVVPSTEAAGSLPTLFTPPSGLTRPSTELLCMLGYPPLECFPYTPTTCLEIAVKCYQHRMYEDAIAVATHGNALNPGAGLLYVKAASQIALGDCATAEKTARELMATARSGGVDAVRQRISSPPQVNLELLMRGYSELPATSARY